MVSRFTLLCILVYATLSAADTSSASTTSPSATAETVAAATATAVTQQAFINSAIAAAAQDAHQNVNIEVFASRDCTGSSVSSREYSTGSCKALNARQRAAFNIADGLAVVSGATQKRHCLCEDKVFLEGNAIPGWGTDRTCGETELRWACEWGAIVPGTSGFGDAYNGRQHLIKHCCDATRENSHYQWVACAASGDQAINDNYCDAALAINGLFTTMCVHSAAGSDCAIDNDPKSMRSWKMTPIASPPPVAPGGLTPKPPPSPAPLWPSDQLVSTIDQLRTEIQNAPVGSEKQIYLAATTFLLDTPLIILPGTNVRIEAGSATMPVLDGQDRTRIFDVIGDNLSCNDASDCSSCTSPSICEGADCKRYICWENKCLVTYGDTASTGVSKEEGPHSCCDNVANLKLGSTCTSSKGQGLLNERAFVHMYGAYCWGGYLMEYCKAREDGAYSSSPPAASSSGRRLSTARAASVTKLTLGELHLTRGRAEQRDTQHSFQSNGGAIRAIYSEVKLQGTKITHSHAVAEKIAASSSYNSFKARSGGTTGSGGGIFAHESKLTIRDGPSGRRAEISSCTARSTDGLAFGGGVLWTMDAHKNFIKTRLTIARANFADCAAVYGGGLMAGDFTGDSAAHAPTNAFVQDVDFDRCHADLINPNDEDQSEVQGAFYGGAAMIYLQDASDTTFERVNVRDCTSRYIGGGVATFSPTIIIDSAFTGCHTSERSGAASTKVNNAGQAGALWFKDEWGDTWATGRKGGAKLVVNRTQFVNNTAKVAGGCVSMRLGLETSVLADVDFTRCGIINTDSVYAVGGAVAVWGQALDSTAASVHSAVELHNAKIRNSWVVSRRAGQLTNVGGGGIWVWASTNNDGNAGHPQSITLKMYDSLVEDCTTWCEADKGMCYGGAALLWKDDVRGYFHGTTFRHNSAIASGGIVAEGGGLYRVEFGSNGIVQFADGTVFEGNAARTEKRASDSEASDNGNVGHSFKLEGGLSLYALPAPPGRYIYATDCMVKRLSCARNAYFMIDDEDCPLAEPYCEQIADPEYEDGKFLAANLTSGPYAGKQCRPSQGVWQQCNWQRLPSLIGSSVQTLESVAEDEDYPYPCLKGMLGSGDVQDQMSPACKSYCPAGFYCPTNMTVTPIPCQVGHYCAAGTSVPVPCAAGTYSSTGVTEQSECINCPAGSYCASGSTAPTQCGVGTYQSNEQQEACVECDVGKYSSAFGASSCQTCGAGNYSSNVLSCLPCGIGEYCPFGSRGGIKCPIAFTTTAAPGAMQEADCICRMGMYLNATYISQEETTTDGNQTITTASLKLDQTKSACVPCMSPTEKTNCTYEGVTLETLPIRPGYWRSSASSGEIRWCYTQSVCVGGTDPAAYCREGHMGAFCHTCKPEFHKDPTGICQPCEGAWGLSMLRLLGVLILLIGLLVAGFALGSRSKRARKDYTEGQFAKGNTETRAVQSAGAVSGGTRQGSLGLPAIGLPALLGVLRLRFPALAWPELPDVQLGELQLPSFTFPGVRTIALPDVTLPELIVRYPQFPWLTGGKFTLAHLAIILRIVFPDLAWPDLPDVSLPEWDWPEMPPLCFPTLPKLALPHWSSAAVLCGVNFEGFSIKVRILISLFQILCQLGVVYSIPWPPIFSGLLSWMAFINLDLPTLVPLGCFMNVNFYFSLVAQTMLLPVLSIIPLVASCSYFCNKRAAMWLVEQSGNLGFWILFVIYPSVSAKCFAVFGCEKVDDGTAWLRVDLSIQCNDGAHTIMQLYSLIMIIIYPIGTPCFYYLAMRRHRLKLDKLKSNQELRARLVDQTRAERRHVIAEKSQLAAKRVKAPPELSRGASKAWRIDAGTFATMPSDTQQRLAELAREAHDERKALPSHIRKLTKGYEARVWWFEIFECVRKLAIACLPVFFQPSGSPGQLIFGLMVCFVSACAYVAIDPFDDVANDTLAKFCQAQIFFSLLSSIALAYDEDTIADSTNFDMLLVVLWIIPLVLAVFLQSPFATLFLTVAKRKNKTAPTK